MRDINLTYKTNFSTIYSHKRGLLSAKSDVSLNMGTGVYFRDDSGVYLIGAKKAELVQIHMRQR